MKAKKGDRVFVLKKADDNKIYVYGFGVHEGNDNEFFNPKIRMDTGEILWGAQCWFGVESGFESFREGRKIEYCEIPDPIFTEGKR